MWHCKYAKEPFNLRLFCLLCIGKLKWLLIAPIIGILVFGGGYYLKNVTFAGALPYRVVTKFFVEYGQDPSTENPYSYFTAYTWNDWMKSEKSVAEAMALAENKIPKEELFASYEMGLPSDVRMPYLTVTHCNKEKAIEIADALTDVMINFGENRKEISSVAVVDVVGPEIVEPDIRTWRACILGAILGTFFALLYFSVKMVVDGAIYLPETFTYRYQVPMLGYCDKKGKHSSAVKIHLQKILGNKKAIAITALEEDIDLKKYQELLGLEEAVCIPSVLQVPEAGEKLYAAEGILLLVKSGTDNAGALEEFFHYCEIQEITIDCALLVEADSTMICLYRGKKD